MMFPEKLQQRISKIKSWNENINKIQGHIQELINTLSPSPDPKKTEPIFGVLKKIQKNFSSFHFREYQGLLGKYHPSKNAEIDMPDFKPLLQTLYRLDQTPKHLPVDHILIFDIAKDVAMFLPLMLENFRYNMFQHLKDEVVGLILSGTNQYNVFCKEFEAIAGNYTHLFSLFKANNQNHISNFASDLYLNIDVFKEEIDKEWKKEVDSLQRLFPAAKDPLVKIPFPAHDIITNQQKQFPICNIMLSLHKATDQTKVQAFIEFCNQQEAKDFMEFLQPNLHKASCYFLALLFEETFSQYYLKGFSQNTSYALTKKHCSSFDKYAEFYEKSHFLGTLEHYKKRLVRLKAKNERGDFLTLFFLLSDIHAWWSEGMSTSLRQRLSNIFLLPSVDGSLVGIEPPFLRLLEELRHKAIHNFDTATHGLGATPFDQSPFSALTSADGAKLLRVCIQCLQHIEDNYSYLMQVTPFPKLMAYPLESDIHHTFSNIINVLPPPAKEKELQSADERDKLIYLMESSYMIIFMLAKLQKELKQKDNELYVEALLQAIGEIAGIIFILLDSCYSEKKLNNYPGMLQMIGNIRDYRNLMTHDHIFHQALYNGIIEQLSSASTMQNYLRLFQTFINDIDTEKKELEKREVNNIIKKIEQHMEGHKRILEKINKLIPEIEKSSKEDHGIDMPILSNFLEALKNNEKIEDHIKKVDEHILSLGDKNEKLQQSSSKATSQSAKKDPKQTLRGQIRQLISNAEGQHIALRKYNFYSYAHHIDKILNYGYSQDNLSAIKQSFGKLIDAQKPQDNIQYFDIVARELKQLQGIPSSVPVIMTSNQMEQEIPAFCMMQ